MSYTGGYNVGRLSDPLTTYEPAVLIAIFLRAPSLILILSIRRALFSGSKAGKGSRNKVHMFFYVHNDQDQLLLPRNGPSNLILDCVAN